METETLARPRISFPTRPSRAAPVVSQAPRAVPGPRESNPAFVDPYDGSWEDFSALIAANVDALADQDYDVIEGIALEDLHNLGFDVIPEDPIYNEAQKLLGPTTPPADGSLFYKAYLGLTHEALRTAVKKRQAIATGHVPGTFIKTLSDIDRSPPRPLLVGMLDPDGATSLHGPGGVGKGSIAVHLTDELIKLGYKIGILDYEFHPEEYARRYHGLGGGDALNHVIHVAPSREWGGAIWDHADKIRELVEAERITYLVIDSAGMACGGLDPAKPEAPLQFGEAIQRIGLPSLTLAHVTKTHDAKYPYGSVYWHNVPRVSWSLMPKGPDRLLVCRKANNYERPGAMTLDFEYWENELREVSLRPATWTLEERIGDILDDGEARTPTAIAAILNEDVEKDEQTTAKTVAATLSKGRLRQLKTGTPYRFTVIDGGRWTLPKEPSRG
jgi:hypothetical protein